MLELLKDRHKGERAVLVCNGPSLNKMDLSFLKSECVIGLNKIFLGIHKYGFYPRYLVSVNEKVLRQSHEEIKKLTSVKFISNRAVDLYEEGALLHILDTHNPKKRFYKNISEGLEEGWTVTYAALQVAYFLGFGEVIIIGMDHRFSYEGRANESKFLKGDDPNHFCSTYFANQEWDNPDLIKSEESYRAAREVFELDGRRILDATLNGSCEIFEKIDYKEIFTKK